MQIVHRGAGRVEFGFDVLDATKLVPGGAGAGAAASASMMLNRNPDNFFAETEQVAFHTGARRAGHRLHQRPAAAGPAVLLPRHAALAAGRPELPRDPDQPRRSRRCTTTSATACIAPGDQRAAASPTSRTRWAAAARSRPARQRRLRALPGAGRRDARSARAQREVRRPLQPGARCSATARPTARRSTSSRRFRFELGKVRDAGDPRAHGGHARPRGSARWPTRVAAGTRPARDPGQSRPPEPQRPGRRRSRRRVEPGPIKNAIDRSDRPEHGQYGQGPVVTRKVAILAADGVRRKRR